ncbi:MAG: hypothetical protein AUG44_13045 [Actinobacteria bacterium 13_1_20CM_3_71_11]|nr:MAG: hypothetical protein AUG44_13045 [Actinobacteria bacterium 13_1_20CM_3_71_11]
MTALPEVAWDLLAAARELYRDDPVAAGWLREETDRFEGPLRVAVAGRPRSGKSTLANAIVGAEVSCVGGSGIGVSGTGASGGGGSGAATWYRYGATPRAIGYRSDGPGRELPIRRTDNGLRVVAPVDDLDEVTVDWPSPFLRHAVLLEPSAAGTGDMVARVRAEADAILYATPTLADPDLRALWPPLDAAPFPPVETIVVLSRADEIGGGRIDALSAARLTARRRDRETGVRGVCQAVVAVSGLIGYAGQALGEAEFEALATLAVRPQPELLLSVDRFVAPGFPVPVDQRTRAGLLDRFGLVGVRLATTLIRTGAGSRAVLAEQLVERSGLAALRAAVDELFLDRAPLLKARSALLALGSVVRTRPHPDAIRLTVAIERAIASAHELRELGLLGALRSDRTGLPPDLAAEARRLAGWEGPDLPARLGVGAGFDDAAAWELIERTCEGLLTDLVRRR